MTAKPEVHPRCYYCGSDDLSVDIYCKDCNAAQLLDEIIAVHASKQDNGSATQGDQFTSNSGIGRASCVASASIKEPRREPEKVIAAIKKAADKPLTKKQLKRLEQFKTKPSWDALLQWVD